MKQLFRIEERPENLVASFGEARLVQSLDGRFELRGGSQSDRIEAQEWVSMFLHEVTVRQNCPPPTHLSQRAQTRPRECR